MRGAAQLGGSVQVVVVAFHGLRGGSTAWEQCTGGRGGIAQVGGPAHTPSRKLLRRLWEQLTCEVSGCAGFGSSSHVREEAAQCL